MSNKTGWIAWSYDSLGMDISLDLISEINDLLKDKGVYVDYDLDEENNDWDFKLNLELAERKGQ